MKCQHMCHVIMNGSQKGYSKGVKARVQYSWPSCLLRWDFKSIIEVEFLLCSCHLVANFQKLK